MINEDSDMNTKNINLNSERAKQPLNIIRINKPKIATYLP